MIKKKTVVIIKGNVKYASEAEFFYSDLCNFLTTLKLQVSFDDGVEYTSPPKADIWIGYSRGIDRLRFASKKTQTIAIGGEWESAINHPQDNTVFSDQLSPVIPNKYHFILSEEMKKKLKKLVLE